jgi:hypothetical protein
VDARELTPFLVLLLGGKKVEVWVDAREREWVDARELTLFLVLFLGGKKVEVWVERVHAT